MKPTHVEAVRMSQSTWNAHKSSQIGLNDNSQTESVFGLPVPFSFFEEREPVNSTRDSTAGNSTDMDNQNSIRFSADKNPSNAGIYIPMHKLLIRKRRQTRRQARPRSTSSSQRTNQRVLMLLNPSATGNNTRSAQEVLFLLRQQNNPLYNLTTANSTRDQTRTLRNMTRQRTAGNNRQVQGKPAIQGLQDLNLVDLTFPLIARNNQVKRPQNDSSAAPVGQVQRSNNKRFTQNNRQRGNITTIRQTSGQSPRRRGREQTSTTNNVQVTRVPPRPNARIIDLRLQTRRQTPSPNSGQSGRTRSSLNRSVTRRPATRLTFVQPVSGQRISSLQRRGSSSSLTRGRPTIRARARAGSVSRQHSRRRPNTPSRTVGRRTSNTPRRTVPRRLRRIQTTRPRSPPDPFTQRFSAGFQRGSSLLHQPPMDFTSFDGTGGDIAINRPPRAPGFVNSLAVQNNIPFPGIGPVGFGGGPGMFLGGGFL